VSEENRANIQLQVFESKLLPTAVFADVRSKPHRLYADTVIFTNNHYQL